MMKSTPIEWTDRTWNPIAGCSPVSPGCANCYASRFAHRFSGPGRAFEGLVTPTGKWTGSIATRIGSLVAPLAWRGHHRVFVNSMSDLFHKRVEEWVVAAMIGVIGACKSHTFQVLTKRPENAAKTFAALIGRSNGRYLAPACAEHAASTLKKLAASGRSEEHEVCVSFGIADRLLLAANRAAGVDVPTNLELLASCESQRYWDERVDALLGCPGNVKGVSLEPLLEPIVLTPSRLMRLQWVIVGCESGPGRRPCEVRWIEQIVKQCRASNVPVFVKQVAIGNRVSKRPEDWPESIRVRMYAGQRWE